MNTDMDPQEDPSQEHVSPQADEPYPPPAYAWFVVLILMTVYVFSFIDRQILGLLVDPIKRDLNITETQMSLLMGFSFALFYTIFGIPLGRLADSKSRRTIIAIGLVVWSLMSAACGLAKNYWHLLAARVGVGVGEATLSPSAYSLITDYFPPHRLAFALSIYGAGIYLGTGLAYLAGGFVVGFVMDTEAIVLPVINEVRPWQLVFFIIGFAGLAFTGFVYLIKEPARRGLGKKKATAGGGESHSVPLGEVFDYIKDNRGTFFCHSLGMALLAFVGYGAANWLPSFFVRVHGWTASEAGIRYGSAVMVFGTLGILCGGRLGDWLGQRGYKDSKMRAALIAAVIHVPFGIAFPLMPSGWLALLVLCPAIFTLAMPSGNGPAAIQQMMPNQLRGQASAIYLFVVNIIGLGLGPTAVALVTQYVFKDPNMVGYSILIVGSIANICAVVFIWAGMRRYETSLVYLEEWHSRNA